MREPVQRTSTLMIHEGTSSENQYSVMIHEGTSSLWLDE